MSISVLMSIYYKENPDFFQHAMESIWDNQILKPDEIILVEDGKLTAELYEKLDIWQNKLGSILKRIPLTENQGLTKALNIGIKHCSGDFIARMDSDDISLPSRFFKQNAYLKNHPETAVIGSYIKEIDEDGNYTNIRTYPITNREACRYICKATPLAHPSTMIRKTIFDKGIKYNESYTTTQDLALWFDTLKAGFQIANIPEILFLFRITQQTFSRRNKSKAFY